MQKKTTHQLYRHSIINKIFPSQQLQYFACFQLLFTGFSLISLSYLSHLISLSIFPVLYLRLPILFIQIFFPDQKATQKRARILSLLTLLSPILFSGIRTARGYCYHQTKMEQLKKSASRKSIHNSLPQLEGGKV